MSWKALLKNPLNGVTSLADSMLELQDPSPNIWEMFHDFDLRFFQGALNKHGVEVDWSPRMTLCAGLCRWDGRTQHCSIKLSNLLLQLRPRSDLVETLIHEMIHAFLFVLHVSDNRESHGPKFHEIMFRINAEAQLKISVYHSFHDEVSYYKTHVWRCKGVCRNRSPYFGYVRRAMNRKPGPNDTWWKDHQASCGGEFEKISEPEPKDKKKKGKEVVKNDQPSKKGEKEQSTKIQETGIRDIRDFLKPPTQNDDAPPKPTFKAGAMNAKTIFSSSFQEPSVDKMPLLNETTIDDLDQLTNSYVKNTQTFNENKSFVPFVGKAYTLSSEYSNKDLNGKRPISRLLLEFSKPKTFQSGSSNSTTNNVSQNTIKSIICINLDEDQSCDKNRLTKKRNFHESPEVSRTEKKIRTTAVLDLITLD